MKEVKTVATILGIVNSLLYFSTQAPPHLPFVSFFCIQLSI